MKALFFFVLAILSSCTYNVNLIQTMGTASDIVDDTTTQSPDINATANIPVTPSI